MASFTRTLGLRSRTIHMGVFSLSRRLLTKSTGKTMSTVAEEPRSLSTSGFQTIKLDKLVEEEELPDYRADWFHPIRLGEVFQDRYQVLAKLGFGVSSTVWLAWDLKDYQYVALKVYVHAPFVHCELHAYRHLAGLGHMEHLQAWDLLGSKRLFTDRDDDGDLYDAAHIAQLIAALGPPPPEFLARNEERRADFWDEQGNLLGLAPIPHGRTLEALDFNLSGLLPI